MWNRRICVGVAYLCLQCAFLPSLTTLMEWTDQQHFAKTKMGYISLTSLLNAIFATAPLALRWMCDSPRTGYARRITPIYLARTSHNRVISSRDFYLCCCLLPQCEALRTCRSAWAFRSQQNGAVTRMRRSCQVQTSQKDRAIGAGMLLQPLRWRCVKCAIHYERDVCEEQHPCGANKQ